MARFALAPALFTVLVVRGATQQEPQLFGTSTAIEVALTREPGGDPVQKNSRTAAQQKLNSQLLVEIARAKRTADAQRRPSGVVKIDVQQRALVDVRTSETASIRRMVLAWASSIVGESVAADSIVAWVPLLRLEELAQSPFVRSIEPAATPLTNRQRQEIR
jgi:hypothetical protein